MIPAPAVIAFLQEREILRLYDALSEESRRRLVLYAFYANGERRHGGGGWKTAYAQPPKEPDLPLLRRILADASPAETDRIYRQAQAMRDAEKKPEGD